MKTLFLDRDGVINIENVNGYILSIEEFQFYEGVLEAMAVVNRLFDRIIVVTNQRCVGKKLITTEELEAMHRFMIENIAESGGRIDKVYFAPALETDDHYRKPNTGMAELAKKDFPEIDFCNAIMVGNNLSDMEFGKSMGMHTVFLPTTSPEWVLPDSRIDEQHDSLLGFVTAYAEKIRVNP